MIRFTLKHWAFNFSDTNVADIVNMHVLVPPRDPVTPRQIKLALIDPVDSKSTSPQTPIKKSRAGAFKVNFFLYIVYYFIFSISLSYIKHSI
jgi:hypothetical protein